MTPAAVAIFVCTVAVDLRASFDRLAALARLHVGRDPLADGAIYLFLNRARTHAKALWWDRSGSALLYKRLERGTFRVPSVIVPDAAHVLIDRRELELILQGIDLPAQRPRARPRERVPDAKRAPDARP